MNLAKPEPHLWLKIEQFLSTPLDDHSALLRVIGRLDAVASAVEAPALVVICEEERAVYRGWSCSVTKRRRFIRRDDTGSSLVWRATFEVPLHVVECGGALFTLTAEDRLALALPTPRLRETRAALDGEATRLRSSGGQFRRHVVALGAGFAAAVAVSAGGIASATTTAAPVGPASPAMVTTSATTSDTTATGTDASMPGDTSTSTTTSTDTTSTDTTSTDTTTTAPTPTTPTSTQTTTTEAPPTSTNPSPDTTVTAPPVTVTSPVNTTSTSRATSPAPSVTTAPTPSSPPERHRPTAAPGTPSSSATPAPQATIHSHSTTSRHSRPTHSDAPSPSSPSSPTGTAGTGPTAPSVLSFGIPVALDPFTAAQITHFESIGASLDQPPAFLIPIYKAAGRRYHVPWQILAAINAIETDYGRDLSVSVAGAVGWMQFEPGTWLQYGVRVDGSGAPNPYDPKDAIFSAARYLAANGAPDHLRQALFAYNHALWYVYAVLWRAQVITDHAVADADGALAGTGNTGLAGAETMLVAALSAVGGPYSQANHDSFGQTAADLRRAGTDCSGFVSWVLDQVDPSFGNQTTVTLPDQPGVQPGFGRYVTMWDRPLPGDQGHVIIDILGTWFESGGNSSYNPAGGISPLTEAGAMGELTGGGFLPYHLKRL